MRYVELLKESDGKSALYKTLAAKFAGKTIGQIDFQVIEWEGVVRVEWDLTFRRNTAHGAYLQYKNSVQSANKIISDIAQEYAKFKPTFTTVTEKYTKTDSEYSEYEQSFGGGVRIPLGKSATKEPAKASVVRDANSSVVKPKRVIGAKSEIIRKVNAILTDPSQPVKYRLKSGSSMNTKVIMFIDGKAAGSIEASMVRPWLLTKGISNPKTVEIDTLLSNIQVTETEECNDSDDMLDESRMPLSGHAYHKKTDDELRFIVKDAGEASVAMKDHDSKAESKYLDQVNDASTILHYRKTQKPQVSEAAPTRTDRPSDDEVNNAFAEVMGTGFVRRGKSFVSKDGSDLYVGNHDGELALYGTTSAKWKGKCTTLARKLNLAKQTEHIRKYTESVEAYSDGRKFTTTHTGGEFKELCDQQGFKIERDQVVGGKHKFIALTKTGEKAGSYSDGLGVFYNNKLDNSLSNIHVDETVDDLAEARGYPRGWAILPATMALYGKKVVDIYTAASEWTSDKHKQTILVCHKNENGRDRMLFIASYGDGSSYKVGESSETYHDQTLASKGVYTILNVVVFQGGEIISKANDVGLNAKASLAVFK